MSALENKVEKFTPGPWRMRDYNLRAMDEYGNACWFGSIGPDKPVTKQGERHIVSTSAFGIFGRSPAEARANARLITAAPDLYEALQFAIKVLSTAGIAGSTYAPVLQQARKAIRLAEGE